MLDVDKMMSDLTARQLSEWMAYFTIEPWGEERADWRAGNIAAMVHNSMTKGPRVKAVDFVLSDKETPRQQSDDEMKATIRAFFKAAERGSEHR